VRLELFGLDSCSDFAGTSNRRARGRVSASELQRLERLLEPLPQEAPPGTVRVLVFHHTLTRVDPSLPNALDPASYAALCDLAAWRDLRVVLTGHEHHVEHHPHACDDGHLLWELRAPTALQGRRPRAGLHGFWVHQILAPAAGPLTWSAWMYAWDDEAGRFLLDPTQRIGLEDQGASLVLVRPPSQ
jgi:hypothetical protein